MLKAIAVVAIFIFGCAVYIAVQDEHATKQHAQQAAQCNEPVAPTKPNENHANNDVYNPERDTPRWYGIFRWPSGITTWAVILTLAAIAVQTRETARAAAATEASVEENQASSNRQS
jgi:hypothetical protein